MSTATYPEDAAFARPATYSPLGSGIIEAQDGLTAREHAAIALRVPESGNEWLDAMIRTAQRNDLAARIVPSLINEPVEIGNYSTVALIAAMDGGRPTMQAMFAYAALSIADAMLSGAATQIAEGE